MMRFFSHFSDVDGLIGGALELVAIAPKLLSPDVLLRERVVRQLVSLLSRPRAEAQVAACRALVAVCRFEALQQEWVAEQGVPPLVALLESEVREVQVAACLAAEAVGSHPEGQEALVQAGALNRLMALARDELHPAQDEAAAALAQLGGTRRRGAAGGGAAREHKGGGEGAADAIESFVLMLRRGGAISREQAALGVCHLCRLSAQSTAKERRAMAGRLVKAGALPALLACAGGGAGRRGRRRSMGQSGGGQRQTGAAGVALMHATPPGHWCPRTRRRRRRRWRWPRRAADNGGLDRRRDATRRARRLRPRLSPRGHGGPRPRARPRWCLSCFGGALPPSELRHGRARRRRRAVRARRRLGG